MGCRQRWDVWVVFLEGGLLLDGLSLRHPRHAIEMSSRQLPVHLGHGETPSPAPCVCVPILLDSLKEIESYHTQDLSLATKRGGFESPLDRGFHPYAIFLLWRSKRLGHHRHTTQVNFFLFPLLAHTPPPDSPRYYPGLGASWFQRASK